VPLLLGGAWLVGAALAVVGRALWWLLRVLWAVAWRVLALTAGLVVVAFSRPLAGRLVALALSAALAGNVVRHLGGMGGKRDSGQRGQRPAGTARAGAAGAAPAALAVKLRPVSAQAVATARYAQTRWFTQALGGPGLLDMLVGPAGVGKSEIVWGSIRAGHDGADFCGLATTKPRRILLLSEMGGETLAPALRRWGLYAEPAGRFPRLDAVRLRLLPPRGSVGRLIDVLYSADIYRPVVVDGELRQVEWPAVIEAVRPLVEQGGYDRVIVDSLGEWLGSDNNDNMLKTLTACRQLTHAGTGVTLLHHTPRTDPKRPRGGTVIEAKLDTGYYVVGTAAGGMPRSRQDPVRELGWFKTRFPDLTPIGSLRLERVLGGPATRPRYQREGAAQAQPVRAEPVSAPGSHPEPAQETRTANEARVLAALRAAGRAGATMKVLAEHAGLPRQRAHEAVVALVAAGRAKVGGYADTPGGGPKATVYLAAQPPADGPQGRLRLVVAPGSEFPENGPQRSPADTEEGVAS
jgi:hypothetical protein